MNPTCPKCNATVHATDRYCPTCGASLADTRAPGGEFVPLPGVSGTPDMRRRRRRRTWYRRPVFVTLALVMAVLAIGAAAAAYYIQQRFEEINTISTPPPVVSGAAFADEETGATPDVQVDTGPAQQALELAASGQVGEFVLYGGEGAAPATPGMAIATPGATPVGDGTGGFEIVDLTGTPRAMTVAATPEPEPTRPASFVLRPVRESEGSTLNVLLMGVDAREGQAIDGEVRPDSLSVLHVDGETGSCRILAIPRDTRTELPGYGLTKINHALALGGVPYEILVVEQLLGIEIDHFGLIDFGGVEGLVDVVGGVTVVNDRAFEAGGFTFAEGEIRLDGEQALVYSRFRQDERGDFGRQERQQQVIRALLEQTSGLDVATNAPRLLDAVDGHFKSDLSAREMVSLATEFRDDCTPGTLETARMDGAIETHADPLLNLPLSYVVVDEAEIAARVAWLLGEDGAGAAGTPAGTP